MSYRAGFVGLIGLPNSGKSTLMNALVGEKVSIVTAKPQTTRRRVMGLSTTAEQQIVFVDSPGVVVAKSGLNKFLHEESQDVIAQSDVLLAVLNIDAVKPTGLDEIIALVKDSGKPWLALIHKVDLPQLHRPQILRQKLADLNVPVVQGSALNDGKVLREILLERLNPMLPEAPGPLYDRELYTLSTTRELCAEILREKCFANVHQEIPFGLAVKIIKFDEDDGPTVKIYAEIVLSKENHRPIVIGREAQVLKRIGTEARKEIQAVIGRPVYLDVQVTSRRNWQKSPSLMKEFGYVVPQA